MSFQDMTGLETQVRNLFPGGFRERAVMMRQEMENGFAQELIAYWTGTAPISMPGSCGTSGPVARSCRSI
jgi:hypothetical protein